MSAPNVNFTFSLKAMVNKDETKVLFVEADNHFVDVLLSFLTMPLGKIVRLLHKHYGDEAPSIGSLTSLYRGLQNLGSDHFWTEGCKAMLLNPRNSSEVYCRKLKVNIDDEFTKYLICGTCVFPHPNVSLTMYGYDSNAMCCFCGRISSELYVTVEQSNADGNAGVFTETASLIILDDLRILPNSIASLHCLGSTGLIGTKMEGAKLKQVPFGFHEIMELLKGLFLSKTPLSDIILKCSCSAANPVSQNLFLLNGPISETQEMKLKLMVQKSTNKVLFGEAEEDLVDFLFSFLAIPLGGAVSLLPGMPLTNINNLYKYAVADSLPEKYLVTPDMKDRLIKPKLGVHYLSSNQILPDLEEETHPPLYYHLGADGKKHLSLIESESGFKVRRLISPRGEKDYVKGPSIKE